MVRIEFTIDGKDYELTETTFRLILNQARFGFMRLKSDPECKITKDELKALDVISTLQFRHRELI